MRPDIETVDKYITKHVARSGVEYAWDRIKKVLEQDSKTIKRNEALLIEKLSEKDKEISNIKEWNIKIVKKKNEQMKAMECCGNCNEWSAFKASCELGMYGVVGKCSNWEIKNSNK